MSISKTPLGNKKGVSSYTVSGEALLNARDETEHENTPCVKTHNALTYFTSSQKISSFLLKLLYASCVKSMSKKTPCEVSPLYGKDQDLQYSPQVIFFLAKVDIHIIP